MSVNLVGRVCPSAPVGGSEGLAACWGQTRPAPRSAKGEGRSRAETAFTMVEVALSLAIVAFALVAIIGVMPAGLNVQKENRQDTIISQDASLMIDAIRGGYNSSNLTALASGFLQFTGAAIPPASNYTALEIVKRLSIPRWDTTNATNLVRAHFRAMSGNLGDAAAAASQVAFSYVVTSEVTNYTGVPANSVINSYLTNNLYEVKLTFQWPVYEGPAGQFPTKFGNGIMVVRTLVSGQLVNDNGGYVFRGATFLGQ